MRAPRRWSIATAVALVGVLGWGRAAAAQMVPEWPASPVPDLLAMLASDLPSVRAEAAWRLAAVRDQRFEGMPPKAAAGAVAARLADSSGRDEAAAAAFAVVDLGPDPAAALALLTARLPGFVRRGADPTVVAALARAVAAQDVAAVVAGLGAVVAASPCRPDGLAALMLLGREAAAAAPAVAAVMSHPDAGQRMRAAAALAALGAPEVGAAAIRRGLDDPCAAVRLFSALALWRSDRPALPAAAVAPWLADGRAAVARAAATAVRRVEPLPAAAVVALAGQLADPVTAPAATAELIARGAAAAAAAPRLAGLLALAVPPDPGDPGEVAYHRWRDAERFGRQVIEALGAIGPPAAVAAPALVGVVERARPYSGLPVLAGAALARIAPAAGLTGLMRLWERDVATCAPEPWASTMALVAMGPLAAPEVPRFLRFVERGPEVARRHAMLALAGIGPPAALALPAIRAAAASGDGGTRSVALHALQAIAPGP